MQPAIPGGQVVGPDLQWGQLEPCMGQCQVELGGGR